VLHPRLGIDDKQMPHRVKAERSEVEIELRIDGAEEPKHKTDGKRRNQRGTRHVLTSTLSFPHPGPTAGNKPIDKPAGNSRGGKDFTIAGKIAFG